MGIFLLAIWLVIFFFGVWYAWRSFVKLYAFLKPVRTAAANPNSPTGKINQRVEDVLCRSGLGGVVKIKRQIQAGVDNAVAASQPEHGPDKK